MRGEKLRANLPLFIWEGQTEEANLPAGKKRGFLYYRIYFASRGTQPSPL